MTTKKTEKTRSLKKTLKQNSSEIFWNLVNAGLAGGLVLLGSLADGDISQRGFCVALIAALIVMATKLKEYWAQEEHEYSRVFNFIQP